MSADNFGVVHIHEDGYGLSMGFASDDDSIDLSKPYFTAPTLREVVDKADSDYFEYGWSYDDAVHESLIEALEGE